MPSLSSLSTQYVIVPVRAQSAGLPHNPTADTVEMAFIASGVPASGDWYAAAWASTSSAPGFYLAQCLVGPQGGGVVLAVGSYAIWVRVTDSPEIPVMAVGSLTITP